MSLSFPSSCHGPLRNVSVPFCQSRSQSAKIHTKTQKVTLSFTQPLIKQTELWTPTPSCHFSSLCPFLTHSFVSLPHSLSSYLHHSSVFPFFISFHIFTPRSSPYLCSFLSPLPLLPSIPSSIISWFSTYVTYAVSDVLIFYFDWVVIRGGLLSYRLSLS